MNTQRFSDVVAQKRLNLDPDGNIFIYDGAPAQGSPANPAQNIELKKLSPYNPFLNIAEQSVSALKAVINPFTAKGFLIDE